MDGNSTPKTKRGAQRREQILRAAEEAFGAQGFSATSIADITRKAGTALGTFYIYFASKEEVFRELVLEMGQLTREAVTKSVADAPDRMSAERAGLRSFLEFVAKRPSLYSIVEEARFVDPEAYRVYFTRFAKAYEKRLLAAEQAGEVKLGDAEVRAWALMGMAKTLGERYVLWEDTPDIDYVVDEVMLLVGRGLLP
ncbi:TetR/AcrR family transcriptional regulator [Qingshengfaniella alkalisoli]|uniref:TetR/AcrR family transcriptional regulator n=1 Tax=Qingshengfaniella alkalisoli TaxID=2599296 RepID=A0A5B8J981_9RHOB|nr:TetR/AcrR family transcriptional regulator [Qingshengfaniella alkalisoli]QDY70810.1 TetR/AcrR family transcriptional regulator [Qingshengfaniella alkalisoli]